MRLKDKVCVVTGSSRGIGKALALGLAREGAKVMVNYVKSERQANDVAQAIRQMGASAAVCRADVSQRADVEHLVEETVREFGEINVMVHNAAVVEGDLMMETSDEAWERQFAVNINGCFYCTQIAAARMIEQGKGGRIINISSICGHIALLERSAYSATKGAIEAFSRCSALELAPHGITVNVVSPGATNTEINIPLYTPAIREALERRIPLGRIAEPEDMAGAVIFFASDESAYCTGQKLLVDGGWGMADYVPAREVEEIMKLRAEKQEETKHGRVDHHGAGDRHVRTG